MLANNLRPAMDLAHTPQGDVNLGTIKNATGGDEPTHTPQGDKQTEGTFLHCIDAAEKFLLLF